jgi:hypothetical protein
LINFQINSPNFLHHREKKKQGKKEKEKEAPFLVSVGRGPNSRGYGWTCSLHLRIHV